MEQQHMYKRTWREPAPTLDAETFKVLWKKQRLAEVRAAILRGDWPAALHSDSDSDASSSDSESRGSASTTSSANSGSPAGTTTQQQQQQQQRHSHRRHRRRRRSHGEHHHHSRHHHHHSQDSDEDPEFEKALQEAADARLQEVLERLTEEHRWALVCARFVGIYLVQLLVDVYWRCRPAQVLAGSNSTASVCWIATACAMSADLQPLREKRPDGSEGNTCYTYAAPTPSRTPFSIDDSCYISTTHN